MSEPIEREDLAAFEVLDELAYGAGRDDTAPVDPPPPDEEGEVLRRLYVESLGLLAYGLEPQQPQPETRATLLAHLIGDETQEISPLILATASAQSTASGPLASPPSIPATPGSAAGQAKGRPGPAAEVQRAPIFDLASAASVQARGAEASAASPREGMASRARPRRRWAVALAAVFALAAAGLGVWVAMLQSEIDYRDSQLRGLEVRLANADQVARDLEAAKSEVARLEQRYTFVTAPALTVFALRPPAAGSLQPAARGHLFLAADRHRWQLEVQGLKPEPELQDYQVWFIVDGLPLSGGVFDARPGRPAFLADNSMPAGTTAIAITLERKGGTTSPTSPILLIADSSVQI